MRKPRKVTVVTTIAVSVFNLLIVGLPLIVVLLSGLISFAIMAVIGERVVELVAQWGEPAKLPAQEETLELEPPVRCTDCGGSLWITDRDDNGVCDPCREKKKTITFEEAQAAEVRRLKEQIRVQKEISERGPLF